TGKLKDVAGEPPLIILPGATGSISPFIGLREQFSSSLWGLQITKDTPLTSVPELASFFYEKIKLERPHGPYRLGAYSGSTVVLVYLTKLLEDDGDEVIQLAFIDHFPSTYLYSVDPFTFDVDDVALVDELSKKVVEDFVCILGLKNTGDTFRRRAEEILLALKGDHSVPDVIQFTARVSQATVAIAMRYILGDSFRDASGIWSQSMFFDWLMSIKARPVVYVATEGVRSLLNSRDYSSDLGSKAVYSDVRVVVVNADHYNLFNNEELVRDLDSGYIRTV
ncbi:Alpha/Beta hydrolase protein, partial [Cyathus striatus]